MVEYDDVKNHLEDNWTGINPEIRNKNLGFSAKYPNFLFIDVLPKAALKPITLNDEMHKRETYFYVVGIAKDKADANIMVREVKRLMKSKVIDGGSWTVFGNVSFSERTKRVVVKIPCKEWIILMNEDW